MSSHFLPQCPGCAFLGDIPHQIRGVIVVPLPWYSHLDSKQQFTRAVIKKGETDHSSKSCLQNPEFPVFTSFCLPFLFMESRKQVPKSSPGLRAAMLTDSISEQSCSVKPYLKCIAVSKKYLKILPQILFFLQRFYADFHSGTQPIGTESKTKMI